MAATILPIRTGSPAPCRATGPRTWPRTTSAPIRPRAMPSGAGSPSASASPRSCARSCRKRCATCSTACALLQMCPARMADGGRSGKRRKGKGPVREPRRRETEAPERKVAEDPEKELRRVRTRALVRHARAVDAIFDMQELGVEASPEQVKELQEARKVFEEVRPYGSHDAEAAYKKNPELARKPLRATPPAPSARSSSKPNCASIRAAAPTASWRTGRSSTRPACASIRQATYPATGPRARRWATWREASNAIRNWNPSSPTASIELGIGFESGRRLGLELAFTHGIDLGRGRGLEI